MSSLCMIGPNKIHISYNFIDSHMQQIPDMKKSQILLNQIQNSEYLLEIEGQCKIKSLEALQFRYLKVILVIIFSIITLIPLILLLNFKKLRKFCFYSSCDFPEADHLYVTMQDQTFDIVKIQQRGINRIFIASQLAYRLSGSNYVPLVLDYSEYLKLLNVEACISKGLTSEAHEQLRSLYGENKHEIEIQNYFEYMFNTIFKPLYILQYIVVLSLTVQGLPLFGIILVVASLLTTSGNYVAMYIGKLKIRKMAEKSTQVSVIRNGREQTVLSVELVPGDILVFNEETEVPCDCVVLKGEMFVNECSLTGQNIPIKKSTFKGNVKNSENWLYDGTKVLQANKVYAVVILTGFASRKGRLLRKILNRVPTQPDFFFKMFFFLLQSFIIGMALYGATLPIRLSVNIDQAIVLLRILDYLVSSVPPAFPVYFTVAYSWSLYRLKKKNILSTMPQKTVEANRLKTACFDKTGTLTLNNLNFKNFFQFSKQGIEELDIENGGSQQIDFIKIFFGSCHSVRKINGQYQGDQVDLKLWQLSGFKLSKDKIDTLENQNGETYKVLVLNQFESRFQSMSVLVKEEKTGKHFVFVKGAPEKIHTVSMKKIPEFSNFIGDLSFKGLRTIAFGWKRIQENQLSAYLTKDREQFLTNVEIIGLATFENALKDQTKLTIRALHESEISTRMITGDNIFIAVEIAYQSGILSPSELIILIEGGKRQKKGQSVIYNVLQVRKKGQKTQKKQKKVTIHQILNYGCPIAVDNDFVSSSDFQIADQMRVFARILPDKKAYIIQCIKQEFQRAHNSLSLCARTFGEGRKKVSMTGDGANDLMAIKEADVGIGISGTDAVYSSAFTINHLDSMIDIIKQGKCTTLNIIQCLKFTLIANYINLVVQILLATQATFISQNQGLYINFLIIILVPILLSLSEPFEEMTSNRVKDNFLCWQNQLSTWGTLLILSGGLVGSYFYVTSSPEFIKNPLPSWKVGIGYNFQCQLVTFVFLGQGLLLASLVFVIYQSSPIKNYFFTTKILTILTALNFIAFTIYFFILNPSGLSFLNLMPVTQQQTGIEYAILCGSIILAIVCNLLLHKSNYGTNQNQMMQKSTVTTSANNTFMEIELVRKTEYTQGNM